MKKIFMLIVMIYSMSAFAVTEEEERQLLEDLHAEQARVAEEATASQDDGPLVFEDEAPAASESARETVELIPAPISSSANTEDEVSLEDEQRAREVAAKAMNSNRSVAVGLRYPLSPNGSSVSLPATPGFSISSDQSRNIEIFGEYRENNLAIEVGLTFDDERSHELFFYGSSLGKMTVTGPQWSVAGKYYLPFFYAHDVNPYVGIGFQQMSVDGFYGMGGVPFETKGDGWHAIGILGAEFPVWERYSIVVEYRLAGTELRTEIPNAGRLNIETGDKLLLGVNARF